MDKVVAGKVDDLGYMLETELPYLTDELGVSVSTVEELGTAPVISRKWVLNIWLPSKASA